MSITEAKKEVLKHSTLSNKQKIKGVIKSIIRPRKFKAICVGTAKSGTHSIAAIFNQNYRSEHEPEAEHLIYLKNELNKGNITTGEVLSFLRKRDVRLNLHMESSDFAGYFFKEQLSISPKTKVLLPIRDCYSFLDSIINHQINNPVEDNCIWKLGRNVNYDSAGTVFPTEEKILSQYQGLYPIKGYLSYWADRNKQVLETVDSKQLLAFKTKEIHSNLESISKFLNLPIESINANKTHSFQAPKKYNLLKEIDYDYIEQLVIETNCKEIMKDFYPEIDNIYDAFPDSSK